MVGEQSIIEAIRVAAENGDAEAERALEWHERNLKTLRKKAKAKKKARKQARASRKKNR